MRILFVHNYPTRFVKLDIDILRAHHSVTVFELRWPRIEPLTIMQQVARHDMVFGWFASWHTFVPLLFARLQRHPSLLIIGGYDVANLPAAKYGSQRGGVKKWVSRLTMRLASQLATFSVYSQREAAENVGIRPKFVPVIYLGLPDPFRSLPRKNSKPLVLTVGNVWQENLWRKGLEPFVRAAAHLPDVPFVVVGAWRDDSIERLRGIATPNVTFTGWVENEDLLDYYRRAHVYVQASAHEGFGMSVAEAMLAGCIPAVTRCGALPEVVGSCGVYSDSQDPPALAQAIVRALSISEDVRRDARQRILHEFPMERRQSALAQIINDVSSARKGKSMEGEHDGRRSRRECDR